MTGWLFSVTLVLYCEVSGDQRWNLSSDVCVEDLSPWFYSVILNDLGLKQTSYALLYNQIPLQLLGRYHVFKSRLIVAA